MSDLYGFSPVQLSGITSTIQSISGQSISQYCLAALPLRQFVGSGDGIDISGNLATAAIQVGYADTNVAGQTISSIANGTGTLNIATVTTASAHALQTGDLVNISSATVASGNNYYNGTFPVNVQTATTFTYVMFGISATNSGVGTYTYSAGPWRQNGYATSDAGTTKRLQIALSKINFDLSKDSILLSIEMKKNIPAATSEIILGNGDAGTGQGFYVSCRLASGKIRPVLNTSGGVVTGLADSSAVFCDGMPHHMQLAIDAQTKTVLLYMDGVISNTYLNAFTGATTLLYDFCIGGNVPTNSSIDAKFRDFHFYKFPNSGLPRNINKLAQRLSSLVFTPLTDAEIIF